MGQSERKHRQSRISDHAQKEISDIVFIELPKAGRQIKQKESAMVIESVKAAFDIYSPVSGKIIRVNESLSQNLKRSIKRRIRTAGFLKSNVPIPRKWTVF